jgi:hypothetical protein
MTAAPVHFSDYYQQPVNPSDLLRVTPNVLRAASKPFAAKRRGLCVAQQGQPWT